MSHSFTGERRKQSCNGQFSLSWFQSAVYNAPENEKGKKHLRALQHQQCSSAAQPSTVQITQQESNGEWRQKKGLSKQSVLYNQERERKQSVLIERRDKSM